MHHPVHAVCATLYLQYGLRETRSTYRLRETLFCCSVSAHSQPVLHTLSLYFRCASACTSDVPQPVLQVCLSLYCTILLLTGLLMYMGEYKGNTKGGHYEGHRLWIRPYRYASQLVRSLLPAQNFIFFPPFLKTVTEAINRG